MITIRKMLGRPAAEMLLDPQSCLSWVTEINHAYQSLNRPGEDAQDIVDLKLSMIFWRSRLADALLKQAPPWVSRQQESTRSVLAALNTYLGAEQQKLAASLLDPGVFARLMAAQGTRTQGYPELDLQAGPGIDLDIVANRGSSTPFEKWRENDLFSRYAYEGEGVRYRGVTFRPGDVLLANVNLDGNGIYTALSEPRSFSSHSAFFAILDHGARRLPVVIETYEKGVRPVPLSVFLGPRFCSYVEVYRHSDYRPDHAARINQSAAGFINSVKGYNFDSEDQDPTYMSCGAVGRFMHQAAGLKPARTISKLTNPQIRKNLEKVGYSYFNYFGPVDFMRNDFFENVGLVDNNQLPQLLARELIDRDFQRNFAGGSLDPSKFPLMFKLNRWGIGQMRRQTLIGRLVAQIEGFTADNLPRGPDDLLAMILIAEKQVGSAIAKTRAVVEEILEDYQTLDMPAFTADERIRQAVQQYFNPSWMRSPDAVIQCPTDKL